MQQLTQQEIQYVNGANALILTIASTGATITTLGWAGRILYEGSAMYPLFEWKNYAFMAGVGAFSGLASFAAGSIYQMNAR